MPPPPRLGPQNGPLDPPLVEFLGQANIEVTRGHQRQSVTININFQTSSSQKLLP